MCNGSLTCLHMPRKSLHLVSLSQSKVAGNRSGTSTFDAPCKRSIERQIDRAYSVQKITHYMVKSFRLKALSVSVNRGINKHVKLKDSGLYCNTVKVDRSEPRLQKCSETGPQQS